MNTKRRKNKKQKSPKATFWRGCWRYLVLLCMGLIIIYVIIYVAFLGQGFFPAGVNLEKKDWLSFLGNYLALGGTVIVSIIATFQSRFFSEKQIERDVQNRRKQIQPTFSISIDGINKQVVGTAEAFSLSDSSKNPVHKNVLISIENVGTYPIKNVIIFNKYLFQLLKCNEKRTIQVAYSDSPDIARWKNKLIELIESDYERTDSGVPKWFNINYEDIDGNDMYQSFKLKEFDGEKYYSLEGTHEI